MRQWLVSKLRRSTLLNSPKLCQKVTLKHVLLDSIDRHMRIQIDEPSTKQLKSVIQAAFYRREEYHRGPAETSPLLGAQRAVWNICWHDWTTSVIKLLDRSTLEVFLKHKMPKTWNHKWINSQAWTNITVLSKITIAKCTIFSKVWPSKKIIQF